MRDGRYNDGYAYALSALRRSLAEKHVRAAQQFVNLLAQIERARGDLAREQEARLLEIDILRALGRPHEEIAEAMMVLASVYVLRGEFVRGDRMIESLQGFDGWRNNAHDIAQAYDVMGHSHAIRGDFVRALDWYQRALSLKENKKIWDPDFAGRDGLKQDQEARNAQIINSYQYLVNLASRFGGSTEMSEYIQQIPISEELLFGSLVGITECYVRTNDFTLLRKLLVQLLALQKKIETSEKNEGDRLKLRSMIASVYVALHEDNIALSYLVDLIADTRSYRQYQFTIPYVHDDFRYIYVSVGSFYKVLRLLARVQHRRRAYSEAIAAQEEAIAVWPRAGFWPPSALPWDNFREKEAELRIELARLLRESKRYESAVESLTRARSAVSQMTSQAEQVMFLGQLAKEWQALNRPNEREEALQAAVTLYESLQSQVADPTQVLLYQEFTGAPLYGGLAELAVEQKKSPLNALTLLEKGRSQALAILVAQGQFDLDRRLTPTDKKEIKDLRDQVQRIGLAVRGAATKGQQDQAYLLVRSEYERRVLELTQRLATLRSRFPSSRNVKAAPPTSAALLRLATSRPDTLFVSFSVGEEALTVFLLSARSGVVARRLPITRRWLTDASDSWRKTLKTTTLIGRREELQLAEKLGAALWPAIAPSLGEPIKRLSLIPDGPLHGLPLAAMILQNNARLIERYPVSYALSLSALLLPTSNSVKRPYSILALADPTLVSGDSMPQSSARKRLGALPFARFEAAAISRGFSPATLLIGSAATEKNLRSKLTQSRILHFATHGIVDPANGLRSWLLLAPPADDEESDGRLEAREIATCSLSADLAVLSACETSLGQISASEGLLGFAWAFHVAGCPSVVGSLWTIDDRATSSLMAHFYERLRAGEAKDIALQVAMKKAIKNPTTRAPYYWAAFLLTGTPQPIATP